MDLENVLRAIEGGVRFARDPEMYRVSVFGTPGDKAAWGWRLEGHHISVRFDVVGGSADRELAGVLRFESRRKSAKAPKTGTRVLGAEEDAGRALLDSLDDTQRTTAIVAADAPGDIVTMILPKVDPLSPPRDQGHRAQQGAARQAVAADRRLRRLDGARRRRRADGAAAQGRSRQHHASRGRGRRRKGKKHYYRIQGPTFLVEYDNTQNDGNHIHSVWRDFNGDFGRDLLREHLKSQPH